MGQFQQKQSAVPFQEAAGLNYDEKLSVTTLRGWDIVSWDTQPWDDEKLILSLSDWSKEGSSVPFQSKNTVPFQEKL